jgi:DNA ligase-1
VNDTPTPKRFRPLLAASIDDDEQLAALDYPLIASPKVDGIRVLIHPELGPVTRSLKAVRNVYIRRCLSKYFYHGLDGEIVVGPINAPDVFNRTTTGVMTTDGAPLFKYYVFDLHDRGDMAYSSRLEWVRELFHNGGSTEADPYVRVLPAHGVQNPEEVLSAEVRWLSEGFEGIMLRHPDRAYKFNRSTLREQTLLKLKRFNDAEAVVIGFEPLFSNQNPQTRSSLGLAERSDHKAGKVEVQTLGNLRVRHEPGFGEFAIGSGFDQATRDDIWNNRPQYLGRRVSFKYQQVGIKDKPRFPIFKGFRPQE